MKTLRALLVDDEIDVALAIARVDVGHAVPLVRQRPQRLRQHAQLFDAHRQLAGLGLEQRAGGREDVAHVVLLERLVGFAQRVPLQEDLDLPGAILQLGEARLAHDALEHHAAGDVHAHGVGIEPLGRLVAVLGRQQRRPARRGGNRWGMPARPRPSPARASRRAWRAARRSSLFSSGLVPRRVVTCLAHSPAFSEASMNGSRCPSSTLLVSPISTSVRRSLMRDWSST